LPFGQLAFGLMTAGWLAWHRFKMTLEEYDRIGLSGRGHQKLSLDSKIFTIYRKTCNYITL